MEAITVACQSYGHLIMVPTAGVMLTPNFAATVRLNGELKPVGRPSVLTHVPTGQVLFILRKANVRQLCELARAIERIPIDHSVRNAREYAKALITVVPYPRIWATYVLTEIQKCVVKGRARRAAIDVIISQALQQAKKFVP